MIKELKISGYVEEADTIIEKTYPEEILLFNKSLEDRLAVLKHMHLIQKENEARYEKTSEGIIILDRCELDTLIHCGTLDDSYETKQQRWNQMSEEIGYIHPIDAVIFFQTWYGTDENDMRKRFFEREECRGIYREIESLSERCWEEYTKERDVPQYIIRPTKEISEKSYRVQKILYKLQDRDAQWIVFTGGSHAGKTTCIETLKKEYSEKYK